jgi:uncharacterized protein with PIN domain
MIPRPCPQCNSELVRTKSSNPNPLPGIAQLPTRGWRCSVCGGEFTMRQIRESRRRSSTVPDRA